MSDSAYLCKYLSVCLHVRPSVWIPLSLSLCLSMSVSVCGEFAVKEWKNTPDERIEGGNRQHSQDACSNNDCSDDATSETSVPRLQPEIYRVRAGSSSWNTRHPDHIHLIWLQTSQCGINVADHSTDFTHNGWTVAVICYNTGHSYTSAVHITLTEPQENWCFVLLLSFSCRHWVVKSLFSVQYTRPVPQTSGTGMHGNSNEIMPVHT